MPYNGLNDYLIAVYTESLCFSASNSIFSSSLSYELGLLTQFQIESC